MGHYFSGAVTFSRDGAVENATIGAPRGPLRHSFRAFLGRLLGPSCASFWSQLGALSGPRLGPPEPLSENSLDVLGCPLALSWTPIGILFGSSQGGSSLGSLSSGTPRTLSVFCLIVHCSGLYSTGLLSVACAIALFRDPHCTYEH